MSDSKADSKQPTSEFTALDADEDIERLHIIESLCLNCQENGETRMLLTKIPYFRDIIVMSFRCEHCGYTNTETQNATAMSEKVLNIPCRDHIK